MAQSNLGTFYGLGVGPGDPELITLKALKILQRVPVVCIPVKKEGNPSYAGAIIEGHLTDSQKVVELIFPMVKDKAILEQSWDTATKQVLEILKNGEDVAFITEGDPFFYSTFIYLFERLQKELPSEKIVVVPGVTAFSASGSAGGFPITNADDRMIVLPSTYGIEKLEDYLRDFETIVLMKVNSVIEEIIEKIEKHGLQNSFLFVERCGRPEQRIITDLNELKGTKINYLSILIVRAKKN